MAKNVSLAPAVSSAAAGTVTDETGTQHESVEGLEMLSQEQSNWCWAAVVQALLRRDGELLSQEAIVTAHLQRTGRTYSCTPPNSTRQEGGVCTEGSCTSSCNDEHSIKVALTELGLFDSLLSEFEAPDFDQIRREIHAQRAVPCHITWTSGEGHIVLVCGWSLKQGERYVDVLDPQGIQPAQPVTAISMAHAAFASSYSHAGKTGTVDYGYKLN